MKELRARKTIQGYFRRILIIGDVFKSVDAGANSSTKNIWLWEDSQIRPVKHITEERVDSVLFSPDDHTLHEVGKYLELFHHILDVNGQIAIIADADGLAAVTETELDDFLLQYSWMVYYRGLLNTGDSAAPVSGIVIVRTAYNPVVHARAQLELGQPWYAITLLDEIPEQFVSRNGNLELLAMLSLEKQRYYLKWQEVFIGQLPDHTFFTNERSEFGQVTAISPNLSESYRLHSRFWARLNRNDMAIRVLQSVEHVSPDPMTRHALRILEQNEQPLVSTKEIKPPSIEWQENGRLPRILVICHDYSDYALDTLYDGLCTLLGKENVVEFPWKPTLHGCEPDTANGYPCVFNYPGTALSLDTLVAQLKSGVFDFILYADVIKMEHREDVRRLVNADPGLPVILYDTWDNCYTPLQLVLDYIGRDKFSLMFKRELLQGVVYEGDPVPLPFGYPESLCQAHQPFSAERRESVFWAGKREYGLRPLYLRRLEILLGKPLDDARFDQESYRRKLRSSLIGLSFFGYGFDTVRYWEVPANGVMLLAERPPIHIPDNFVDGETAVFFDNVAQLEEKLEYYLKRPEEVQRIAAKGHEHYLKYHTTAVRALNFIGVVCQQVLNRGLSSV